MQSDWRKSLCTPAFLLANAYFRHRKGWICKLNIVVLSESVKSNLLTSPKLEVHYLPEIFRDKIVFPCTFFSSDGPGTAKTPN